MNKGKIFSKEDLEEINRKRERNDKMEEFLKVKRSEWNDRIEGVFETIKHRNMNAQEYAKVIDAQALALSYIQKINEESSYFLNKMSKEDTSLKENKQEKFIFYSTGFGLKTNLGEKKILIDGHVAEDERGVQLLETHIDFLRESVKNLQSFNYSIKNLVALMEYLGE